MVHGETELGHQPLACLGAGCHREAPSRARHYLDDASDPRDPRVSPLLMEDMTGLPPAVVTVSGFDPLRDEGIAYAQRLADAGVPTQLLREGGLVHAFIWFTGISKASREGAARITQAIAAAVALDPAHE